jgi:hypothetical protein
MKFLGITTFNVDKLAEVVKAADKLGKNPPEGYKLLAMYSCQSNPFSGTETQRGDLVTVSIIECDNAEALAAANLEMTFAGATVNRIPVLEVSTGEAQETVEQLKT